MKPSPKPLAVQLYSLRQRGEKDLFGVLKDVAAFGYAGVEFAGLYGNSPAAVRKVVDDLGLKVCSAHVPVPTRENLNELVDTAKSLGYTRLISGKWIEAFASVDAIKATAAEFRAGAEMLKPHGLRLGYHNHWVEVERHDGRLGMEWFSEFAPDVFSEMDIYWASHFGDADPAVAIRACIDRVELLHVKDGPLTQGQPHTAVGDGKVDIAACIAAADPGRLEWLIVELDECATDMTDAIKRSAQYLVKNGLAKGR